MRIKEIKILLSLMGITTLLGHNFSTIAPAYSCTPPSNVNSSWTTVQNSPQKRCSKEKEKYVNKRKRKLKRKKNVKNFWHRENKRKIRCRTKLTPQSKKTVIIQILRRLKTLISSRTMKKNMMMFKCRICFANSKCLVSQLRKKMNLKTLKWLQLLPRLWTKWRLIVKSENLKKKVKMRSSNKSKLYKNEIMKQ